MISVLLCGIATIGVLGTTNVAATPVSDSQVAIEAFLNTGLAANDSKSFATVKGFGPDSSTHATKSFATVKGFGPGSAR